MRMQILLAWRYLMGRKQRMALTTLAVVFGVALLFGMNALLPSMTEAFRHNMITTAGKVDLSITSVSNNPFAENEIGKLSEISGISQQTQTLQKNIILPESMGGAASAITGSSAITLTGVDVNTAQSVRNFQILSGRFFSADDTNAVIVPQILADKLELSVGDIFSIPSSQGTANLEVIGILSLSASAGLDEVFVPLATAQQILNLPGMVNTIEILIKPGVDRAQVESDVLSALGSDFKSGQIEAGNELASALSMGESMMWLFGILALAMAAFIIFNTFRTVIAERRRDLGMLRAIGASKRTVMGLILVESLIQGFVGTAIGLVLGYLLAALLISGYGEMIGDLMQVKIGAPVITLPNLLASVLLGVGFTVGSGYFPARSAMKITPMEALRPALGAAEFRRQKRRALWGFIMIVASLVGLIFGDLKLAAISMMVFFVGLILVAPVIVKPVAEIFGKLIALFYAREGKLAEGNLSRQPGRAAITASAMMIGLAICITLIALITSVQAGFMSYLDKSLGTDFLLMPPSLVLGSGNLGAGENLLESIKQTDGIEAATSLRWASSGTGDLALQIIGIDPLVYGKIAGLEFSQGDETAAYQQLADGRAIIINGIYATATGTKVGDTLTLMTPNGEQRYKVAGVAFDYLNAKIQTGYISQQNIAQDFNSTSDVLLLANMTAGADKEKVLASLKSVVSEYPSFTLIDSTSFKQEQQDLFNTAMSTMYVLVIMLALPGLIAMANTMSINVIERTREIGMLRAVGMSQPQVKHMILAESILLSALGTSMGILVGLFLSTLMLKALNFAGFNVDFFFPGAGVLMAVAVGLAFGVIAAMIPARQASRTIIVEALRYE